MADVYHRQIRELHTALTSDSSKTEAAEILRTLIDAIILTPEGGELSVYLKGDLAGILTLSQNKTKPLAKVAKGSGFFAQQVTLVAGVGFEPIAGDYGRLSLGYGAPDFCYRSIERPPRSKTRWISAAGCMSALRCRCAAKSRTICSARPAVSRA